MDHIRPAALRNRIADGATPTIVDVRDPDEFQRTHLDPGNGQLINVPYHDHDDPRDMAAAIPEDTEKVYVICWAGVCSQRVCHALEREGYDTVSIDGGMQQWNKE